MILVDAVHENQHIVYGGQPHRIREEARWRAVAQDGAQKPHDPPLDRLPESAQTIIRWAASQLDLRTSQSAEIDWSPEEWARMYACRQSVNATLGDLPPIVLARTTSNYRTGMRKTPESLEPERRDLQADLAKLSRKGTITFTKNAGHNLHVEGPELVIQAVQQMVWMVR